MDRDRRAAFLALKDIAENDAWSNLAVSKQLGLTKAVNPAFVRELVYGVVRNQYLLDFNIDRFLKNPKIKTPERILLRMGFYQLAKMNVADYGAINETVNIAKTFYKGKESFINAVLRNFQREGKKLILCEDNRIKLSVNYSCHESIVNHLLQNYGTETTVFILEESNKPAPLCIRVNRLKSDRESLMIELSKLGFECRASMLSGTCIFIKGSGLLNTQLYKDGYFSVQGEASQLAVEILNPKAGETMIDMCAAPGGKTCAAAENMNNTGSILAFDIYPHRVELIKKEYSRLGLNIIKEQVKDACEYDGDLKADCVLADVLCSGLGTLRRNPELKLKPFREPTEGYEILCNAAEYAKDRVLYSTCTINPNENEGCVRRFLSENPGWTIDFEQQFMPKENGPDGFYICLLRKKND